MVSHPLQGVLSLGLSEICEGLDAVVVVFISKCAVFSFGQFFMRNKFLSFS